MAEENKNPRQLNIDIPEELATGVYSNFVIIGHSQFEFVADFITLLPAVIKPKVCARVILNPYHAKRLLLALQDNIQRYEEAFGTISTSDPGNNQNDFPPPGFGGPTGFA